MRRFFGANSLVRCIVALGCLRLPAVAAAQSPAAVAAPEILVREADGRQNVRALRLPSPLQLDGRLDEPFYRDVHPFGDFVQQEPHEGQPATEKTEGWVFFDDKNIYVALRLWETDSSKRVMSDMRRDAFNLYNNDHVAILFDTFHDHRNGFGFSSNAQEGLFDWQTTNEQPSPNWNSLWDARTANFEGGWTVEFRIPFRSIRFAEGGPAWGINIRRMVRWKNEISYLSPVPVSWGRRGLNKLSNAGSLLGIEVPTKLRNLDVKPYALGAVNTNKLSAPPVNNDGDVDLGVDAKWGLTQSLVADLTFHTDFAQVEDDESQVNLSRFSVLFPEKRDFFLEGQDVFSFGGANPNQQAGGPTAVPGPGGGGPPTNLTPFVFFSRRIGLQNNTVVPIDGGARLIGRTGPYQIGALYMHTARIDAARAVPTSFSVVRVNRDVLSRSRIGMIATHRAPGLQTGSDERRLRRRRGFQSHDRTERQRVLEYGSHHERAAVQEPSKLSRLRQLERRQDRPPGRTSVSRRRFQSRNRLPPPVGIPADLRPGKVQPAPQELARRAEDVLRSQPRLP